MTKCSDESKGRKVNFKEFKNGKFEPCKPNFIFMKTWIFRYA